MLFFSYIVDRELVYDEPSPPCQCPPGCRACMNACPTNAIYAPFKLDPSRCIGYSNWMRIEERRTIDPLIPREIRPKLGIRIFGCDRCQEACPRNREELKKTKPEDPVLEEIAQEFDLRKLLHMPEGFFEECVQPLMHHYGMGPVPCRRNAAIAMGNTGDASYIPDLTQELAESDDEYLRIYAAWALGQMHDPAAGKALKEHLDTELSEAVREEIRYALARAE